MKIVSQYEIKLPVYSLSYLINADSSGIDESDKIAIDRFMKPFYNEADSVNGSLTLSAGWIDDSLEDRESAESYFSNSPEFGSPCDVEDYTITILV